MKEPVKNPYCSMKVGLVTPVPALAWRRNPAGSRCDAVVLHVATFSKPVFQS
jgi:hypothetical protein